MLRKLTVENFFSIKGPETLDLAINRSVEDIDKRFAKPIAKSDARFPRVVALYGANASGKTNVLRAGTFLANFAANSSYWKPDETPYFFSFGGNEDATKLSIEFDAQVSEELGRVAFIYDLEIAKDRRAVNRETLRYYPGSRSRLLFDRELNEIRSGEDFDLSLRDPVRQRIRPDASVISTLAQFNHYFSKNICSILASVSTNISVTGKHVFDITQPTNYYRDNANSFNSMKEEIKRFDTGINDIDIISINGNQAPLFKHQGFDMPIVFSFESQGTQNFYKLYPLFYTALQNGSVAVLDELDSDIHPHLLLEIVRWFQDPETNPHDAQLIFSCHNPSLLEHLTKEEVYLTEKRGDGQTHVFGVKDIKGVRRDINLYEKYLAGAFGGVPRLG
jgi:hypothetical protein